MTMGNGLGSGFFGDLADGLEGAGSSLLGTTQGDDVSRFAPPNLGSVIGSAASQALTPGVSMFGPLLNGVGSLLSSLGNFFSGGSGSQSTPAPVQSTPQQGQQYFGNATASSTGDPHLAFNGTSATGSNSNAKWDSMASHQNLLDSNSFAGGYRVSTTATAPNSSGVTYNQSASVSTNGGRDSVTLGVNGSATISRNGHSSAIADGQSFSLGNGETVSRAQNGSLTIDDTNSNGGSISTTLSENGNGVDVNVQANNVDLGGDLAGGPNAQTTGTQTAWNPPPFGQQLGNHPSRRYTMDESPMELGATD
jgi:hypothetical protein